LADEREILSLCFHFGIPFEKGRFRDCQWILKISGFLELPPKILPDVLDGDKFEILANRRGGKVAWLNYVPGGSFCLCFMPNSFGILIIGAGNWEFLGRKTGGRGDDAC